jgi:hypothetical protein
MFVPCWHYNCRATWNEFVTAHGRFRHRTVRALLPDSLFRLFLISLCLPPLLVHLCGRVGYLLSREPVELPVRELGLT